MYLRVKPFIEVCTQLAFQSSFIIKEIYQDKKLQKKLKAYDDPVTKADLKVQKLIITGIRKFWPQIQIVGQQQIPFEEQITYNYDKMDLEHLEKVIKHDQWGKIDQEYQVSKCCVWIDPLDGTRSFVKGYLDNVTTLIGLTVQKKCCIGIVCSSYYKEDNNYIYFPRVYFSVINHPIVFNINKAGVQYIQNCKRNQKQLKIATSYKITKQQQQFICKEFQIKKLDKKGGSGNKVLSIINKEVDIVMYLKGATSKWDICGPQVLLQSLGGKLSDINGNEYLFDAKEDSFSNNNGVICCSSQQIGKLCKQKFIKFSL